MLGCGPGRDAWGRALGPDLAGCSGLLRPLFCPFTLQAVPQSPPSLAAWPPLQDMGVGRPFSCGWRSGGELGTGGCLPPPHRSPLHEIDFLTWSKVFGSEEERDGFTALCFCFCFSFFKCWERARLPSHLPNSTYI